ncbi:MAG: adenine deaminase [Bacillota bacterium]|nr:MAG: adenine deaminase [Bacillota bacterium]
MTERERTRLISVAAGREKAELVLKNANIVNVFTQKIEQGDLAVDGGVIAGIGDYEGIKEIDCGGKYLIPGLIDGHMHIESTQLTPAELAKAILPHGTTTLIADPHEIANVCGNAGVEYIAAAAARTPLTVKVMYPSCVPATPFENSGAVLDAKEVKAHIADGGIWGLGEYMNYPAVINAAADDVEKLCAAENKGCVIDGHAPDLTGKNLNAYLCGGISTDHECVTEREIEEKIARGMYVHLREGSATRNAEKNAKAVNARNMRRFILCTDDRHACDLKRGGHVDNILRILVKNGVDPIWAVVMGTLNTAECYRLHGYGALAPDYAADIVCVDDLTEFNAAFVVKNGKVVAENGRALFDVQPYDDERVKNTVHPAPLCQADFDIVSRSEYVKVIRLLHHNVVTEKTVRKVKLVNGKVDVAGTDLLKLAVVERHKATGNVGRGLIEGYGLKNGAIALTVAHDSHNIIVLGDTSENMYAAAAEIVRIGGGMALVENGKVKASLPLEIAGLMSELGIDEFENKLEKMIACAYEMGVAKDIQPFMSLSFLALVVIPELKITDRGLFDVAKFGFTPIEAEDFA